MSAITPFGAFHTVISIVALGAGAAALVREHGISMRSATGRLYIAMTILSCVTGFFIFHHGGFGKPHALGIVTLLVIGLAMVAGQTRVLGRLGPYVETVAYSATVFFHLIPTFVESATRLPVGAPLTSNPEDPAIHAAIGAAFLLFLLGATAQVIALHRKHARAAVAAVAAS
jgi:hypothetical protein